MNSLPVANREQERFLNAIVAERYKQDVIWGGRDHDQDHGWAAWAQILNERVQGLYGVFDPNPDSQARGRRLLIEIAAIACAAFESR